MLPLPFSLSPTRRERPQEVGRSRHGSGDGEERAAGNKKSISEGHPVRRPTTVVPEGLSRPRLRGASSHARAARIFCSPRRGAESDDRGRWPHARSQSMEAPRYLIAVRPRAQSEQARDSGLVSGAAARRSELVGHQCRRGLNPRFRRLRRDERSGAWPDSPKVPHAPCESTVPRVAPSAQKKFFAGLRKNPPQVHIV